MVTYLTEISMFMVKVHLKIMKSNFMYFNEKFVCSIVIWRIIAEKIDCFLLPLLSYIKVIIGEGNGTPIQYPCLENPMDGRAWQAPVHGVAKSRARLSHFTFTFHFPAWEKEMATHSSILAWRIPGTEEPSGLPSMGLHRVGHDWSDLDPEDCSPPGSSIHGILQARILEWVAISFSRGSCRPRDRTQVSHIAGRRFNLWATRDGSKRWSNSLKFHRS